MAGMRLQRRVSSNSSVTNSLPQAGLATEYPALGPRGKIRVAAEIRHPLEAVANVGQSRVVEHVAFVGGRRGRRVE